MSKHNNIDSDIDFDDELDDYDESEEEEPINNNVLIISTAQTFIVKGLELKMSDIGVHCTHATTKIKSIEEHCDDADIYVLYMDEELESLPDVLVFLNDICKEKDKKIFVIGTRLEYAAVTKYIVNTNISEWFERPLDMAAFLQKIQDCMDEAAIQARKKSILIVDDVTYMRMISEWLQDLYRVSMANSGAQAIAWLARNKADLILLDYEMPITPGPKVLEMLKAEVETGSIPVMFLTGKSDRQSIVNVLSLRPADYLLKSIDRAGLREKLGNFFLMKRSV